MDVKYALKRLFETAEASRKAQKAFYRHPGDLKTDQVKKEYLSESKRRETDLDQLLTLLPRAFPYLKAEEKPAGIQGGFMTVPEINAVRLASWKERLNEQHSTPQVLIGVGIGPVQGRLMVLATEELSNEAIILFMEGALDQLKQAEGSIS